MPYDDPDPTDPQMLVGIVLPSGPEAMRDMAYAFAEEFARMGHERERIASVFRNPFYAGAHGAYRALGPEVIAAIIDECVAVWGRARPVDRDADTATDPGGRRSVGAADGAPPIAGAALTEPRPAKD